MSELHRLLPALVLALVTLLISSGAVAAPTTVACRVLAASGAVYARNAQGHERLLHRRSRVYVGETLVTKAGGRVQVRFSDGGLVALPPSSVLKVNSYHYDGAQDGTESEALHLIEGGMRTVSGAIGHKHPNSYGVKAGTVATIGIRGTEYVLQLCHGNCGKGAKGLYGGVLHGQIVVKNASGTTPFSTNQYFRVANAQSLPKRLLAPPTFLNRQSVPVKKQKEKKGESKASSSAQKSSKKKEEQNSSSSQKKQSEKKGQSQSGSSSSNSSSGSSSSKSTSSESSSNSEETNSSTSGTTTSTSSSTETSTEDSGTLSTDDTSSTATTTTDTTSETSDTTTTLLDPATTASSTQTTSTSGSTGSTTFIDGAVLAPSTGGFGLSFIKNASGAGLQGASGVLTLFNGNNSLLLNTVNGVGNVPVYGLASDPNSTQTNACNPCSFSVGTGKLSQVGGVGGTIPVNWGRWDSGYVVTENGVVDSTVGGFNYIYSPDMTTPTQISAMTGSFTYALPTSGGAGTNLVDESGGTGKLTTLKIGVNFSNQTFTSANLATNTFTDGRQFSMSLFSGSPTDFSTVMQGKGGLELAGACSGGSCGSGTGMGGNIAIGFVGPNAERMITGIGLQNCGGPSCSGSSTIAVSGVAVLNR